MHTITQRLNGVSALATTVLLCLLAAVSVTTFIIPTKIEPASINVSNLNVVMGRAPYDRKEQEFVFAKFDIEADLRNLLNWNSKQVFLQFVADYSSPEYPNNQVVIWDRIIRRKKDARINVESLKNKYAFKEISQKGFRGLNATYSLQYNVMPYVGLLTYGEAGRTEPIPFPPRQEQVR